jgi:nucleotide-binding universal stress UspA family protein
MSGPIIVAYDGTPNADDAVALGRQLAQLTGRELMLAHIYRAAEPRPGHGSGGTVGRDGFLRRRGQELLGSAQNTAGDGARTVVEGATTTATGIRQLAERERASLIVFGSARDGEPGRVHPGSASRRLLQGAPCAVAFAPVGFRERPATTPSRIAVSHDDQAGTARRSAEALTRAIGSAQLVDGHEADLLLIGSRPDAEHGRVMISASAEAPLRAAASPAIVVARDVSLPVAAALESVA